MTSRNPLHGLPAEVKARLRERAQPRHCHSNTLAWDRRAV